MTLELQPLRQTDTHTRTFEEPGEIIDHVTLMPRVIRKSQGVLKILLEQEIPPDMPEEQGEQMVRAAIEQIVYGASREALKVLAEQIRHELQNSRPAPSYATVQRIEAAILAFEALIGPLPEAE